MNETRDLVVMGLGELGQFYSGGALRLGLRVTPITRRDRPASVLGRITRGTPLLISVGEADLDEALAAIPPDRRADAVLIQNELFPSSWQRHGMDTPTVAVPWLLKKRGLATQVARKTPVAGRHANLFVRIHEALSVPAEMVDAGTDLNAALVAKYGFILTINALGMIENLPLADWSSHDRQGRVAAVAREAIAIATALLGSPSDANAAIEVVRAGMQGLPDMKARGRTAPARLTRALEIATKEGLAVPALRVIADEAQQP